MSVYLDGTSVLLDSSKVATSSDCCCGGNTGACCDTEDICTEGVTQSDCEGAGGTYLGDGSTCTDVDCTCCPVLARFNTITFSGQVIGCTGGTITLPTKTWARLDGSPGCNLDIYQWSADSNCGCDFQAQNCFPFTETNAVSIDEIGDCDDPNSFFGCVMSAFISCADQTVTFAGSSDGTQCCDSFADTGLVGPYNILDAPLDVTVNATSGNTSIQFRFQLSFS